MATSPTQLSLAHMRKQGYLSWITETWCSFTRKRKDLWTICDVLCVRDDEVCAVQTTSYSNMSARIKKITECEHVAQLRKANIRIEVHGWRKVGNRWQVKVKDLS